MLVVLVASYERTMSAHYYTDLHTICIMQIKLIRMNEKKTHTQQQKSPTTERASMVPAVADDFEPPVNRRLREEEEQKKE